LNPCPRSGPHRHLHAYPVMRFKEPNVAPAHCRLPSVREIEFTNPARSLRRFASLLSTFPPLAGVAAKTSRSIKPRERDLRDLRLFVLVRFFTRPTNRPRHAACTSNFESKPVRPQKLRKNNVGDRGNCATVVRFESIHRFRRLDCSA